MVVHALGVGKAAVRFLPGPKDMIKIKVKCSFCGKVYFREIGRFNEAKKFGWKQYCSKKCQNQAKVTGVKKICANPNCRKKVCRELSQFRKSKSGNIFCSSSCAAIVNNFSRRKIKICPACGKQFRGERKYCSNLCRSSVVNPKKKSESQRQMEVLNDIKTCYKIQERIPTKKERPGLARRAQAVFGTWNKAIEAAGFEPNPVKFSKKYLAKDGHICDSFAEKIIDEWLFKKKIKHERRVPYPNNKSLTADFMVENNWIEFFGLAGELKDYDEIIKRKRILSKKYKLPLIEIYPKDLFPVNRLSEILRIKNIKI